MYKYRTIDKKGFPMKRPMIDVELINGKKHFTEKALIDSGADTCAISSDMATALGMDLNGEKSISYGVTGSIESISKELYIRLNGIHESYNFRVPVKVLFVDEQEYGSFVPLLGRLGLFDAFKITFEQNKSRIILKPTQPDNFTHM